MNRIDQLTCNVEALCLLLPEVTAATQYATPGTALAREVDAAYEHLWGMLIEQSAQVERPTGWWMRPSIYRPTTNQCYVAERLANAIDRELHDRTVDDNLRRVLRDLVVQLRGGVSTLPQPELAEVQQ